MENEQFCGTFHKSKKNKKFIQNLKVNRITNNLLNVHCAETCFCEKSLTLLVTVKLLSVNEILSKSLYLEFFLATFYRYA